MKVSFLVVIGAVAATLACSHAVPAGAGGTPPVVPHVDLARYGGVWYEIARFPHRFEEGCTDVQATYTVNADGTVGVLNECTRDGRRTSARGKARVADTATNAKLRVTFFWPFYGDYWIFDLGRDYDYALVGAPDRNYLWILARKRSIDEALYASLVGKARDLGFDTTRFERTRHASP